MSERYGKIVLDELVNLTLLKDLFKENKIQVTQTDIDEEITRLTEQLGGEDNFQTALSQYGLTRDTLAKRLEVTIGQKKLSQALFNPEISEQEITDYYKDNKVLFEKQTLDEVKDKIKENILTQKLQQEFSTWFNEQKEKASIRSFI